MKRILLFLACILASLVMSAQEYFPEGTKWTEIRLDTLKYDSWYSKVGDEWMPNFETIEYYVKGEYTDNSGKYKCVYTNGPEWTDSLTLLISEANNNISVAIPPKHMRIPNYEGFYSGCSPCIAYQFDWSIGTRIFFDDLYMSSCDGIEYYLIYCGTINEIKEDFFGGTRLLKYADLDGKVPTNDPNKPENIYKKGVRIIQGIGVTEWNDEECLFGPPNPYSALSFYESYHPESFPERHYRSMLVHFERNGEVLYDVWPDKLQQDDYRPLLEEEKVWKYSYNNGMRQYMKSLTVSGDTIIGNQTYKKIIDVASQGVEMFLREEGKKVYCCYPYKNTEILLYDFSKNAGDIVSNEIKNEAAWIRKVIAVDTIMVEATPFRCLTVHEYLIPVGNTEDISEKEYNTENNVLDINRSFWVEGIGSFTYLDSPISYPGNYYTFYECQIGDVTYNQKDFLDAITNDTQPAYRPFVEDGKVWKVGDITTGNPVQLVEYYYFDGDTIIDGKTCKQMMCLEYLGPNYRDYKPQDPLRYVGAWYEEDKKVYEYDTTDKQFKLMYDFSLEDNGTFQKNDLPYVYVIGPRKTGGIKGFKGVYRDVLELADGKSYKCAPWMEGVGGIYGNPKNNVFNVELGDPGYYLMSCTVGDEVIYLNDDFEDGATPESMGVRKRFDFTHTIKIKPKAPMRREAEQPLYGEYNDLLLGINLDPLDDAYLVSITNETGKVVYEKSINAGNIVGLNIDISAYAKGHYTVIVENSDETFTGEFDAQTTGIEEVRNKKSEGRSVIYNLQGQRLHSLQKGLNFVNGQKVFVK